METLLAQAVGQGKLDAVRERIAAGDDVQQADDRGRTLLYVAAEAGKKKVLRLLLEAGADPNIANEENRTPLVQAAWLGKLELVEALLAAGAKPDGYGFGAITPLMVAIDSGHEAVAERLLAAGADPTLASTEGHTALMKAAGRGMQALVEGLLARGCDPNQRPFRGMTPLLFAMTAAKMGTVRALLAHGADVNLADEQGRTPLLAATLHGRARFVAPLLEAGAFPDPLYGEFDSFRPELTKGATPLMVAAHQGKEPIVAALLAAGADPNRANDRGETALDLAEQLGHGPIIDRLRPLTSGARPADPKTLGPRLVRASETGRLDEVDALLDQGADPDARDPRPTEQGRTALIAASAKGHLDVVRALLARGADAEATTTPNTWLGATVNPLIAAAEQGHLDVVRALLDHGARVDATGDDDESALLRAARYGSAEVARLLLVRGADPLRRPAAGDDDDEARPGPDPLASALDRGHEGVLEVFLEAGVALPPGALVAACRNGLVGAVTRLLDAGADINAPDSAGDRPLHAACEIAMTVVEQDPKVDIIEEDTGRYLTLAAERQRELVALLLGRGADPRGRGSKGRTALHAAASMQTYVSYVHAKAPDGNKKHTSNEIDTAPLVRMLLECGAGADVDATDEDGNTPLMSACGIDSRWGKSPLGVVRALLKVGADPNLPGREGKTPLFAAAASDPELVRALLDAGADPNARDEAGVTPLLKAIDYASDRIKRETVPMLIAAGADVNACDRAGASAMDRARDQRSRRLVEMLEAAGARREPASNRRLRKAVEAGDVAAATRALEAGADAHRVIQGFSSLELAAQRDDAGVIGAMVAADVAIDRPNPRGVTALVRALDQGAARAVAALLKAGADPNARDERGWAALVIAASRRDRGLVAQLRDAGASGDDVAEDFLAVLDLEVRSRTPEFERAVELVREATGEVPAPVEPIPGARSVFVRADAEVEEALGAPEAAGASKFGVEWNVLNNKVRGLIESLRPRLAPLGASVLDLGRPIGCGPTGKFVLLLPTTEPFTLLAACGPWPGNNDQGLPDVLRWFRDVARDHPLTIFGAGRDFVDVRFDAPISDEQGAQLAAKIAAFCPDAISQGLGSQAKLARHLVEHRALYFWWD